MYQTIYTNPGYNAAEISTLNSIQSVKLPSVPIITIPQTVSLNTPARIDAPYVAPVPVVQQVLPNPTMGFIYEAKPEFVTNPVYIPLEPADQTNYLAPPPPLINRGGLGSGGGVMSDRFSTLFTSSFQASTILVNSGYSLMSTISTNTASTISSIVYTSSFDAANVGWISTPYMTVSSINLENTTVFLGSSAGHLSLNRSTLDSIGIGSLAGADIQNFTVNIGGNAGAGINNASSITSVGYNTANNNTKEGATIYGYNAGVWRAGAGATLIGAFAGYSNCAASTIVINATMSSINGDIANSFYVAPIRSNSGISTLVYNPSTFEITYNDGSIFSSLTTSSIYTNSMIASTIYGSGDGLRLVNVSSINGASVLSSIAVGGTTYAVQYNNSGTLGGDSGLTYQSGVLYTSSFSTTTVAINSYKPLLFTYGDSYFNTNFIMGDQANITGPSFIAFPTNFFIGSLGTPCREFTVAAGLGGIAMNSANTIDINSFLGMNIIGAGEVSITAGAALSIESVDLLTITAGAGILIDAVGVVEIAGLTGVLVTGGGAVAVSGGGGVTVTGGGAVAVSGGGGILISGGGGVSVLDGGGLSLGTNVIPSAGVDVYGGAVTAWGGLSTFNASISSLNVSSINGFPYGFLSPDPTFSSIYISSFVSTSDLYVSGNTLSGSLSTVNATISSLSISSINGLPFNTIETPNPLFSTVNVSSSIFTNYIQTSSITTSTINYRDDKTVLGFDARGFSTGCVAIGANVTNSGNDSISIGSFAKTFNDDCIAIGRGVSGSAGTGGKYSILVGTFCGVTGAGENAIAIGEQVGITVPIPDRTTILNASSSFNPIASQTDSFYVNPIRSASTTSVLYYDVLTKEVTYQSLPAVISVSSFSTAYVSSVLTTRNLNTSSITLTSDETIIGGLASTDSFFTTALGKGSFAGGASSVAVGKGARTYGNTCIALGSDICLGSPVGSSNTIVIGTNGAFNGLGNNSIAIGNAVGTGVFIPDRTVVISGTTGLNPIVSQTDSFYISPVRINGTTGNILYYNDTTKEVTQGAPVYVSSFSTAYVSSLLTVSSIVADKYLINGNNTSLGSNASATGGSVAFGSNTVTTAAYAVGMGISTNVNGLYSIGIGNAINIPSGVGKMIVLNADSIGIAPTTTGATYINPIRATAPTINISTLCYNPTTYELTYADSRFASQFNTSSLVTSTLTSYGVANMSSITVSSINSYLNTGVSTFITSGSISTASISTLNGTRAGFGMPKQWYSTTTTTVSQTGTFTSYLAINNISSVTNGGFIASANLTYTSAVVANDKIFAQFYVNGNPMGISSIVTNTGNGHTQQITGILGSTFTTTGSAASTNSIALYIRNNAAVPSNYTTNSATMTIMTNLI